MKNALTSILCLIFLTPIFSKAQIPTRIIANPSFEIPVMTCSSPNWNQFPQSEFIGWKTTDTGTTRVICGVSQPGTITRPIEIWMSGFLGVNAYEGNQFAEINANINGFLYQEICLLSNESVAFSIRHRRRESSGSDVFRARIESSDGVLVTETSNMTSSNNNWNLFTGTLNNNSVSGLKRYGFVAISGTGPGVGNLIDNVSINLRPLVDIKSFSTVTVNENNGVTNLEIYVNGTVNSTATVVLNKDGTASYGTDYAIGIPSRGSLTVNSTGRITLTLPPGTYNPNQSTGTSAGLISIPITAVNDLVNDPNETIIYTVGTTSGGGNGNSALNLASQVNGQSATCSAQIGSATVIIEEEKVPKINLTKSCILPGDCTTTPQIPGTNLTYQINFTNIGGKAANNLAIVDGIPVNTDFRVGSATASIGTTGLTYTVSYSNNYDPSNPNLATWGYTPASGGGGAPTLYDRNVKAVRWSFSRAVPFTSPNNTGNVRFITRIR